MGYLKTANLEEDRHMILEWEVCFVVIGQNPGNIHVRSRGSWFSKRAETGGAKPHKGRMTMLLVSSVF